MREGDSISSIFNPRRPRTPSVVITSEDAPGVSPCTAVGAAQATAAVNGPFTNLQSVPLTKRQDSQEQGEQESSPAAAHHTTSRRTSVWHKVKKLSDSCFSIAARKVYFGVFLTALVTGCWVGTSQAMKLMYRHRSFVNSSSPPMPLFYNFTSLSSLENVTSPQDIVARRMLVYDAPFCTTWFMGCWNILFLPLYLLCKVPGSRCTNPARIMADAMRPFREKGFTAARFFIRLLLLTALWVATYYCYVMSLRTLLATDVMALYAVGVSFAYLLAWVILHEQFVGVRIVAVILCCTGVALLAYMDGITSSPTLPGVLLAASAAAGSAVFKVMFRKLVGVNSNLGQISVCYSSLGLLNACLLWPVVIAILFSGSESVPWPDLPWFTLLAVASLLFGTNLLSTFGVAITYEFFITLGFIMAVPLSAGVDVLFYRAKFEGMKLSGIVLITVGFFLVLFPDNWPDYITRLLRNAILLSHSARWSRRHHNSTSSNQRRDIVDYRTGYIRSHLRSPSGRVR